MNVRVILWFAAWAAVCSVARPAYAFDAASPNHHLRGAVVVAGGERALSSATHRVPGTTIGEGTSVFTSVGETSGVVVRGGVRNVARAPSGPLIDTDADGVRDAMDNCPYVTNPAQEDHGGVGAGSPSDGVGDACQCGDVSGDGRVTTADAVMLSRSLLVPPRATLMRPELCDVGGTTGCTNGDGVILRRTLLQPPGATIHPRCAPARGG